VADKKSKSKVQAVESGAAAPEPKPSLGHLFTETRERKGLTRDQVANEAHLPPHYVKMIESDRYDMISDRLYLVPFLRRYAAFLGLDPEDVASRFVSDVQHSESNVVRISQEITMVAKRPGAGGRIAFAVLIVAVVVLLADLAWRRFVEHEGIMPVSVSSPAPRAEGPNENLPPATIVGNPEAAASAAQNATRPASLPPPHSPPAPQEIPREPAGDN